MKRLTLYAFLLVLPLAAAAPAPTPYCQPVVFADFVLPVGQQAVVVTPATCTRPALVRKESNLSKHVSSPVLVPVGKSARFWLFTHRLAYSLDGKTFRRVQVR